MVRRAGRVCLGLAAVLVAAPASAEGYRGHKAHRDYARAAPIKDCTRLNGRFGYYANPWCTAAEQARWDRWSARKRWLR